MESPNDLLAINQKQLQAFCQRWQINELALFGSILRKDFSSSSDIDILVSFAHHAKWTLLDRVEMQSELRELLGRPVDLVSRRGIENSRNRLRRQEILGNAQVVYASS